MPRALSDACPTTMTCGGWPRWRARAAWAAMLALTLPMHLVTAQAELQGRVTRADSTRRAVPGVVVMVPRVNRSTTSDSAGRFRITGIPVGDYLVVLRAIGFQPESAMVDFGLNETIAKDFALVQGIPLLEPVDVRGVSEPIVTGKMAGFYERKAARIGAFIDRALLAKYENRALGEILAGNVPGARVQRGTGQRAWVFSGRAVSGGGCAFCGAKAIDPTDRAAGARPACYMDVYLDGAMVYDSAMGGALFNLNSLEPSSIEGIEVYSSASQIPIQYNRTSGGCGVVLIWTR